MLLDLHVNRRLFQKAKNLSFRNGWPCVKCGELTEHHKEQDNQICCVCGTPVGKREKEFTGIQHKKSWELILHQRLQDRKKYTR